MEEARLYRSRSSSIIGGVAGGFGEYLNIDPVVIRIIFIVLALVGGGGVLIYLVLWIFVPIQPESFNNLNTNNMEKENQPNPSQNHEPQKEQGRGSLIAGAILITLGVLFLIDRFFPRIDFGDLWPVILIVAGIFLLRNSFNNPKS